MIISEKREVEMLLFGLGVLIAGLAMFLTILNFYGYSKDFFTLIGKVISILIAIFGISTIVNFIKFSQDEELKFNIKENNYFLIQEFIALRIVF